MAETMIVRLLCIGVNEFFVIPSLLFSSQVYK